MSRFKAFSYRWERMWNGQVVEGDSLKTGSKSEALRRGKAFCAGMSSRRAYHSFIRVVRSDGSIIATYYQSAKGAASRV